MSSHSISLPNAIQRVLRWLCGRGGYTYFLMDIHKEFTFEGKRYKIEGNKAVEMKNQKTEYSLIRQRGSPLSVEYDSDGFSTPLK